jgi:hypothetical protein
MGFSPTQFSGTCQGHVQTAASLWQACGRPVAGLWQACGRPVASQPVEANDTRLAAHRQTTSPPSLSLSQCASARHTYSHEGSAAHRQTTSPSSPSPRTISGRRSLSSRPGWTGVSGSMASLPGRWQGLPPPQCTRRTCTRRQGRLGEGQWAAKAWQQLQPRPRQRRCPPEGHRGAAGHR